MQCPRCEGQGGMPEFYRDKDGWSHTPSLLLGPVPLVGPAWFCLLCGHRWPRDRDRLAEITEPPALAVSGEARPVKNAKRSAAAKAYWAGLPPEKKAARVERLADNRYRGGWRAQVTASTKAKVSAAATAYWAGLPPDQKAARVKHLSGPHRRGGKRA